MTKSIVLPCLDLPSNTNVTLTHWNKGGTILITRNHSKPVSTSGQHLSIQNDSSLFISRAMIIDEEMYQCDPQPRSGSTSREIFLQVTGMLGLFF